MWCCRRISAAIRWNRMSRCRTASLPTSKRSSPASRCLTRYRSADRSVCRRHGQVAQLVRIADDIDRGDLLARDRHAHGVIEFAVEIEQGAERAVDHGGFDADVVTGVL